jgi:hypothetical protein
MPLGPSLKLAASQFLSTQVYILAQFLRLCPDHPFLAGEMILWNIREWNTPLFD